MRKYSGYFLMIFFKQGPFLIAPLEKHGNCPKFRSAKRLRMAPVPGGREMYIKGGGVPTNTAHPIYVRCRFIWDEYIQVAIGGR